MIATPLGHRAILSNHHLPLQDLTTLPHHPPFCHPANLPPYQPIILPHRHTATPPQCHTATSYLSWIPYYHCQMSFFSFEKIIVLKSTLLSSALQLLFNSIENLFAFCTFYIYVYLKCVSSLLESQSHEVTLSKTGASQTTS